MLRRLECSRSVLSERVFSFSMLPLRSMTFPSKAIASAKVVFPEPGGAEQDHVFNL